VNLPTGVAGPWLGGLVGVEESDLGAVAKCVGNEGRWDLEYEFAEDVADRGDDLEGHALGALV
jgi:hypothetical protein